jgi:hypothetical protein
MYKILCFLLIFLTSFVKVTLVLAQGEPKVVKVMGRAEIISAGITREAKAGDFIKPGESVRLVGKRNVSLEGNGGKIKISLKDDTLATYDGDVSINSRPWKDGVVVRPVMLEGTPENERFSQFSVTEGKAEVDVIPGQPLRVVTPLVVAAVRGTSFTIAAAVDGTSSLSIIEGQVLALGRNGLTSLIGAGQGFEITPSQFNAFVAQSGETISAGGFQNLDFQALKKLDAQV